MSKTKIPNHQSGRFNNNLKYYRERANISQEELSRRTKISRTYISGIEVGDRRLTLNTATRIADILHVNPYELLGMDAIKYTGEFMDTLNSLVHANFDNMVNGIEAKTVSPTDFNIYMIIFELISHQISEEDIITIHKMVKLTTDRLPERKYRDD